MNKGLTALKIIVGLVLGLCLCAALVWHLNLQPTDAARLMVGMSWPWVAAVFLLSYLIVWSIAQKWHIWSLALYDEPRGPSPSYQRHVIWQSWLGQFVPPSLALIVGRGVADKKGASFRSGVLSGVYDQAVEFILLASMIPAGVAVLWGRGGWDIFLALSALGYAIVGGIAFFVLKKMKPALLPFWQPLVLWSLVRVIVTVARLALGALALGLPIDPLAIAAAAPIVALLALIPLTPGNLGLAEWGWVGILSMAGTNVVDAGLLAIGFRVLVLIVQTLLLALYEAHVYLRKT